MPDLEHYHLRLADDLDEVIVGEQVYSVPISESQMRALEDHGQYLVRIGASRLGLKLLAIALAWRAARGPA